VRHTRMMTCSVHGMHLHLGSSGPERSPIRFHLALTGESWSVLLPAVQCLGAEEIKGRRFSSLFASSKRTLFSYPHLSSPDNHLCPTTTFPHPSLSLPWPASNTSIPLGSSWVQLIHDDPLPSSRAPSCPSLPWSPCSSSSSTSCSLCMPERTLESYGQVTRSRPMMFCSPRMELCHAQRGSGHYQWGHDDLGRTILLRQI